MKRILMLPILACVLFLLTAVGCQQPSQSGEEPLRKAQEIQVISLSAPEQKKRIAASEEIRAFVESLQLDQWKPASSPSEEIAGQFVFYQEGTQTLLQQKEDMQKLAELWLCAAGPYVTLEIGGVQTDFQVPETVWDSLQNMLPEDSGAL